MPQHNMESPRSQWQQGLRPPWITRVAGGQSPASSGAESDTESSSTESDRVSEWGEAVDDGDVVTSQAFSCQTTWWWHIKPASVASCIWEKRGIFLHPFNPVTHWSASGDFFPYTVSPALKSWRWVHWGSCHRPQCSKSESQRSTNRRRN